MMKPRHLAAARVLQTYPKPGTLPHTQLGALQEAGDGQRRGIPGRARDDRQRPAPRAAERRGQCPQGRHGLAPAVQRLPGEVRVETNAVCLSARIRRPSSREAKDNTPKIKNGCLVFCANRSAHRVWSCKSNAEEIFRGVCSCRTVRPPESVRLTAYDPVTGEQVSPFPASIFAPLPVGVQ